MTLRTVTTGTVALALFGTLGCAGTAPASRTPAAQVSNTTGVAAATTAQDVPRLAATDQDDNPFPGTHVFERSNGEVLYCRYEPVAGTRIPKRVCATEEVMRNQAADSRRFIDLVREGAAVTGGCVPNTGSGC